LFLIHATAKLVGFSKGFLIVLSENVRFDKRQVLAIISDATDVMYHDIRLPRPTVHPNLQRLQGIG
jgi:hypothetical protein